MPHRQDDPPGGGASLRIAVAWNLDFETAAGVPAREYLEADAEIAETATAICRTLEVLGHVPVRIPVRDSSEHLPALVAAEGASLVFNLVESLGGDASREWEVPACLAAAGIPYTGNHASTLRLAQAKDTCRRILSEAGVPVAPGLVVEDAHAPVDLAGHGLSFPLFVKPARVDGSIGVDQGSLVRDEASLRARLVRLSQGVPGPYLVEAWLPGREVNVAIVPGPGGKRCVVTEIDFGEYPEGYAPIVTYDCKWIPGSPEYVARSVPCTTLDEASLDEVVRVALAAFVAIGGTGYGRIDMRMDASGQPCVIDVNPNPDIHPDAGFCRAASFIGQSYDELVVAILSEALSEARPRGRVAAERVAQGIGG